MVFPCALHHFQNKQSETKGFASFCRRRAAAGGVMADELGQQLYGAAWEGDLEAVATLLERGGAPDWTCVVVRLYTLQWP